MKLTRRLGTVGAAPPLTLVAAIATVASAICLVPATADDVPGLSGKAQHTPRAAEVPLRPAPDAFDAAPPALQHRLRTNAYDYFRFVNRPWISRVCDAFHDDSRAIPVVRLHGDAHVEQFTVAGDEWGLDDFDDSARGPAVIDIVRFIGSIDLATRQRGWTRHREIVIDRFMAGYKRGLADPDARPGPPGIVRRIRAVQQRSRAEFLAWGEAQMEPMEEASRAAVNAGLESFAQLLTVNRPGTAPGYFRVIRAGWLRMGIGSAVTHKILVRIQGPTDDPIDDELLEAKELQNLDGLDCLDELALPALRTVVGSRQLGRLRPNILAGSPEIVISEVVVRDNRLRDWWIRSWDPSYREVHLDDLRSVDDLAAIAYDSGVQLGAGSLEDVSAESPTRQQAINAIAGLESRIRTTASRLVEQLLAGWKELGGKR